MAFFGIPFVEFEPKQQNRFEMIIGNNIVDSYLVKATDLPNLDQNPVVVDYINTEFKVKGKSRWQDITVTIYDKIGQSAAMQLHDWINEHHHRSSEGIDGYAFSGYKRQIKLVYLAPVGAPADTWTLHGAFVASSNWGNVDMSSDDIINLELTLSYDWAELGPDGVDTSTSGVARQKSTPASAQTKRGAADTSVPTSRSIPSTSF